MIVNLCTLIATATLLGLALVWLNTIAGSTWLKLLSLASFLGCFGLAVVGLVRLAVFVL